MPHDLLLTKLLLAPPQSGMVARPRLLQRLDDGAARHQRLFLLSAPAGFGKTALVSQWLHSRSHPAAWLSLEEGDSDPLRFWQYLVQSLRRLYPEMGGEALAMLQSPSPPPLPAMLTSLLNDLSRMPGGAFLALDDYHHVADPAIHKGINFLLDHLPPACHLIVTTRADPPLQLARRRARGEMCELRAADLRFTLEEAAAYLNHARALELSGEEVEALENRTEGWITALQMAALSLQSVDDRHAFIVGFSGDDRYIADYLVEEVLARLPADLHAFLLATCTLDRLCASLCSALTGQPNSQEMLERLEDANLFLSALDRQRKWFRYHPLFARLLQQTLERRAGKAALQRQQALAAAWYEGENLLVEAAACAIAAREYEHAARLLERGGVQLFMEARLGTLLKMAAQLPEDLFLTHPRLTVMCAWAASALSRPDECKEYLLKIEKMTGMSLETFVGNPALAEDLPDLLRNTLLEGAVIRSRFDLEMMNLPAIFRLEAQVLPLVREEMDSLPHAFNPPSELRCVLLYTVGWAQELIGRTQEALENQRQGHAAALKSGNTHIQALTIGRQALLLASMGDLSGAWSVCQAAVEQYEAREDFYSPYLSQVFVLMGKILYDRNDLAGAEAALLRGHQLAQTWNFFEALFPAELTLAHMEFQRGSRAAAIERLTALAKQPFARQEMLQGAVQGDIALFKVLSGAPPAHQARPPMMPPEQLKAFPALFEQMAFQHARYLFFAGDAAGAVNALRQVLESAAERAQTAAQASALLALALESLGRRREALECLRLPLDLSSHQGHTRLYLDYGQPMHALLQAFARQKGEDEARLQEAQRLCRAFSQTLQADAAPQPALLEPLSERELEVLRLMAQGASNAEIARKLVLSLNTVKKHGSHIFEKLGASTRLQAVEAARRMNLIP